jgi:hypothetical protein
MARAEKTTISCLRGKRLVWSGRAASAASWRASILGGLEEELGVEDKWQLQVIENSKGTELECRRGGIDLLACHAVVSLRFFLVRRQMEETVRTAITNSVLRVRKEKKRPHDQH